MDNLPDNKLDEILEKYATPYYASGRGEISHDEAKTALTQLLLEAKRETAQAIIDVSFNPDCIFCGLKDKKAIELKSGESK